MVVDFVPACFKLSCHPDPTIASKAEVVSIANTTAVVDLLSTWVEKASSGALEEAQNVKDKARDYREAAAASAEEQEGENEGSEDEY